MAASILAPKAKFRKQVSGYSRFDNGGLPVRQIVYFSTASDRQDAIVLAGIVAQSHAHNLRDGITGLLVAGGHRYLQVIEGPDAAIRRLALRLRRDDRHLGMTVMIDRKVVDRHFDGWSMAFAKEPRVHEYATFADLVAQMRRLIKDAKLREQLDCFARTFSSAKLRIEPPLWQLAANDEDDLAVDCGH